MRLTKYASAAEARAAVAAHFQNRSVKDAKSSAPIVRAAAGDPDTTEIMLYDEIGMWGVTAKDFVTALAGVVTPNVVVRINSPGGDVFDGLAIHAALKSYKGNVKAKIEGVAASAASFIALAASEVAIDVNSFMMIHNAWGMAVGDKADMRDMATALEKIDGQLAAIYAAKTGKSAADMAKLMDGESDGTWFTAAEAKDIGLVDKIAPADPDEDDDAAGDDDKDGDGAKARIDRIRARLRLAAAG